MIFSNNFTDFWVCCNGKDDLQRKQLTWYNWRKFLMKAGKISPARFLPDWKNRWWHWVVVGWGKKFTLNSEGWHLVEFSWNYRSDEKNWKGISFSSVIMMRKCNAYYYLYYLLTSGFSTFSRSSWHIIFSSFQIQLLFSENINVTLLFYFCFQFQIV